MYASLSVIIEVFSTASVYGEAVCSADTAADNKASSATVPDDLRENSHGLSRDTPPRERGSKHENKLFSPLF